MLAICNAMAAAMLNIASFEANRRCGALSMAVAANLKQVFVLFVSSVTDGTETRMNWRVCVGSLMTVVGGMWYALASKGEDKVMVQAVAEMTSNEKGDTTARV
jgi:hypothetical protein